jgi:hypothetical protein
MQMLAAAKITNKSSQMVFEGSRFNLPQRRFWRRFGTGNHQGDNLPSRVD